MNSTDQHAIAAFLEAGGHISRVDGSVRVNEAELLDYLASCGVTATYKAGDSKTYLCQGKRISMSKLIAIANEHRRAHDLPPFAPRIAIRYTGSR